MNDLEYLNQISAKPAPAPTGFFDKKTKLIAIIGGVVLFLAIVLMIVSGGSSKSDATESSELSRLYLRASSLEETVNNNLKSLKSSSLRSSAASLSALLTEAKSSSSTVLESSFGIKTSSLKPSSEDTKLIDTTNKALESARLNGILDRKFASEMHYQIELFLLIENSVLKKTSNESLSSYLTSSYESLSRLSETLYSFSESK